MADCSTLLDEDLESFVFNYLTDSPEPGEGNLSLDFPEIDLSQLDASDFDSNSCFNELQWCNNHSENESSQYSTDDSELFQIIDSENEALLEALTQTLDDMQEDDISLSAFISSGDGDFCPLPDLLSKPSFQAESPKSPENEDKLSILKKLLLSPAQMPVSNDAQNDGCTRRQGTSKFRPQRGCSKVESPTDRQPGFPPAQSRSCTELQRHLVTTLPQTKVFSSTENNQDSIKEEDSDSQDDEQCDDDSVPSLISSALEDKKPQFTCEREKRAVVDLIRYMHTYCLPAKKQHSNDKHQHWNNISKRPKLESTQQISCSKETSKVDSRNTKVIRPLADKYNCIKPVRFSILKELLAKDISGDVSKPYRLAQPVYAEFSDSCGSHLSSGKEELELGKNKKNELGTTHKSCLTVKKESRHRDTSGKPTISSPECVTVKSAPKPESSVYAVRRSSRLNPEFSGWLMFDDESFPHTSMEKATADLKLTTAEEPFIEEEQVAELEVGELGDPHAQVDFNMDKVDEIERDSCEVHSDIVAQKFHPSENPRCPPLSLSQSVSTFEKRNFEQVLAVELCGTAGLTPPTTPPYKTPEEDHYKPELNQDTVDSGALISCPSEIETSGEHVLINRKQTKKQPERTELFAHLSRTGNLPANCESQGLKRPFSRSFGDHDYCMVKKPDTGFQRKVKSLDLPGYLEKKETLSISQEQQKQVEDKPDRCHKAGNKLLKDHEIRASLTKHFGFPDDTLKEENQSICNSPEYDSVFEDSDSESSSPQKDSVCPTPHRTKVCPPMSPPSKSKFQYYPQTRTSPRSSRHYSPENRRTYRVESNEKHQTGTLSQRQIQKRRQKAIDEGRVIYIRNLSNSISANELKRRFEVFGEITECRVLSRSRGEKYGFITYRCSEHAALSLKKGASLRKRNEPSFHLSYGGLRHLFWTKYTDLDSNAESSPALIKSKYESMDFDSLLKEAQRSLHR
ncbi:peroxisome proliferator-activated receptor gamma coactivator 1-beta [Pelobates cultripes]|uniref:Peroxisome proliferator-activated receptor gamma coactivator 1-beta n=2 Tax=Pelobates cultripes TaxID=61616 RepID=A0AAD1VXK1_PELCU|nr:peroxisome proliferator-activated receptor gamma coactivator 1-beta [Pelobates cultripes]